MVAFIICSPTWVFYVTTDLLDDPCHTQRMNGSAEYCSTPALSVAKSACQQTEREQTDEGVMLRLLLVDDQPAVRPGLGMRLHNDVEQYLAVKTLRSKVLSQSYSLRHLVPFRREFLTAIVALRAVSLLTEMPLLAALHGPACTRDASW
jgi:hypothetical protein